MEGRKVGESRKPLRTRGGYDVWFHEGVEVVGKPRVGWRGGAGRGRAGLVGWLNRLVGWGRGFVKKIVLEKRLGNEDMKYISSRSRDKYIMYSQLCQGNER